MCKLQVIRKIDNNIISDTSVDLSKLKRVSINNLPYYLTIETAAGTIMYRFKYISCTDLAERTVPDCDKNVVLSYGTKTGRLYALSAKTDSGNIDNRTWEQIKKYVTNYLLTDPNSDLHLFIKILQEYNLGE